MNSLQLSLDHQSVSSVFHNVTQSVFLSGISIQITPLGAAYGLSIRSMTGQSLGVRGE